MENNEIKVLAKVGNKEITNLDLENVIASFDPYRAMQFQTEEAREKLVEDLIYQELFCLEAKEAKVDESDEFKRQMEIIKDNVLKQFAIDMLLSSVEVTDEEMLKYYEENKEQFIMPESMQAKHILVDNEEKANDIHKQIVDKEISFEDAAVQFSTCPSSQQGGDLGEFGRGQMVPEFEEAVFALKPGEMSKPVQTQFGHHIILAGEKKESKQSEYEEVKENIREMLLNEKRIEVYTAKVAELSEKYKDIIEKA